MGGDRAPEVVLEGIAQLQDAADASIEILLVGPEPDLRDRLGPLQRSGALQVLHAPDVIEMDESPAAALKGKPESSIHRGLAAVKDGTADAFVSAGNTGAVMAAAVVVLGRLPGVSRPAIPGIFPMLDGHCVVVDVGANVDCKAEHLLQFARMGSIYAERVLGCVRPRVGLLNVGEEPSKGNEAAKAAHALLCRAEGLTFVGNVEGRDLMLHAADVVVCDGFVGNILLKFGESIQTVLPGLLRQATAEFPALAAQGEALADLQQVLAQVMRRFSYEEFGGLPLLGVDGTVLIGHGGSSPRAVARMIAAAAEMVRADVLRSLLDALAPA